RGTRQSREDDGEDLMPREACAYLLSPEVQLRELCFVVDVAERTFDDHHDRPVRTEGKEVGRVAERAAQSIVGDTETAVVQQQPDGVLEVLRVLASQQTAELPD